LEQSALVGLAWVAVCPSCSYRLQLVGLGAVAVGFFEHISAIIKT
jgi:hypothetical protein